jgi:hypothetical protein
MTAYIATRLAQDGVALTLDQAIIELLVIGSMGKNHGNKYFCASERKTGSVRQR